MSAVSSTSTEPTPAEAAILSAAKRKGNNNGRAVRQTDSHAKGDAGKHNEYSSAVSVQTHNQMIVTFTKKFADQEAEIEALRQQLAEKKGHVAALTHNLQVMIGPDNARDEASEQPKAPEGLKGVHRISMQALIKKAEPIIENARKLKLEAEAVSGSILGVYQNSADYFKVKGAKKKDEELMTDLGIYGVKTTVKEDGKDKEVVKAVPIAEGLYSKFQNACVSYTSMVNEVCQCLSDLLEVERSGNLTALSPATLDMVSRVMLFNPNEWEPATKQHLDMYTKICEMRNTLQLDKDSIDYHLDFARSKGNWVAGLHYEGIGLSVNPDYDPNGKIFKFTAVDKCTPVSEAQKTN